MEINFDIEKTIYEMFEGCEHYISSKFFESYNMTLILYQDEILELEKIFKNKKYPYFKYAYFDIITTLKCKFPELSETLHEINIWLNQISIINITNINSLISNGFISINIIFNLSLLIETTDDIISTFEKFVFFENIQNISFSLMSKIYNNYKIENRVYNQEFFDYIQDNLKKINDNKKNIDTLSSFFRKINNDEVENILNEINLLLEK